jgi:hypothetical protein
LRTWWTSIFVRESQTSQPCARSRRISSLRLVLAMIGDRSVRTAAWCRRSGMPPKRATSGFLPRSRCTVTWKQVRGPSGVSMVVLYLAAILVTVDRCFPARAGVLVCVLAEDVLMRVCPAPHPFRLASGIHVGVGPQGRNLLPEGAARGQLRPVHPLRDCAMPGPPRRRIDFSRQPTVARYAVALVVLAVVVGLVLLVLEDGTPAEPAGWYTVVVRVATVLLLLYGLLWLARRLLRRRGRH